MDRAKLAWRSGTLILVGLLVSLVGVSLQFLAPQGSGPETAMGGRALVQLGEQGIVNYLGYSLVGLGGLGLAGSGVLSRRARRRLAGEQQARAGHLQTLAAQAEPLLAAGGPLAAVHAALVRTGASTRDSQQALQLDWPHGRRCARCRANLRRMSYTAREWHVCTGCGWIGLPDTDTG